MWKIVTILLVLSPLLYSGQYHSKKGAEEFKYINILGKEGISEIGNFGMIRENTFLDIIRDFEEKFSKIRNGYPDYYRNYFIVGGTKPSKLYVELIPKSLVPKKYKEEKMYRVVFGDKRTLEVSYDLKTKKLTKVHSVLIFPNE